MIKSIDIKKKQQKQHLQSVTEEGPKLELELEEPPAVADRSDIDSNDGSSYDGDGNVNTVFGDTTASTEKSSLLFLLTMISPKFSGKVRSCVSLVEVVSFFLI